jgi:hypothetical protein
MDTCHSSGLTRQEGPRGRSRYIPDPPPLTVEANPLDDLFMPERFAYLADATSEGTRALQVASGFGSKNDHSHVLLAACGRNESAYESHDGHGIFTTALLSVIESVRLEEETYDSLMDKVALEMPRWYVYGFDLPNLMKEFRLTFSHWRSRAQADCALPGCPL